jgi:hypothetical protein
MLNAAVGVLAVAVLVLCGDVADRGRSCADHLAVGAGGGGHGWSNSAIEWASVP